MQALDRALNTLEKTTGFSRAFDDVVVRRGGWPNQWLTPQEINHHLTVRGFWTRGRQAVHFESRVRLVQHYLDGLIDTPAPAGDFWGTDAGASGSSISGKSAAATVGHGWKRFDGQYKHNPKTKLIEYRGVKMGRSFDRRAYQRTPVDRVTCQYGPVINMSPIGMMFTATEPREFQTGQRGYVRINHGETSLRVRVKIVWLSAQGPHTRVGVDYRGLTPHDRKTIEQIILLAGDADADEGDRRKSPRL
ncbi:MAG: PilZ domain-containing protein [Planctomycetota bacterium]